MMDKLNEILQEVGISKVKLAKYLGVSRQMIYNYLEMNDISNQVEEKIKDALYKICECDFDINPKILKGKNEGCKFCEFKECCFVTHDDYCYFTSLQL